MSTRLLNGKKTVILTDPVHIEAYKAKGWTTVEDKPAEKPNKKAEAVKKEKQ